MDTALLFGEEGSQECGGVKGGDAEGTEGK